MKKYFLSLLLILTLATGVWAGSMGAPPPMAGGKLLDPVTVPSNGQVLKYNSTTGLWTPATDSTGGTPTFDAVATGSNTTATMTVDTGGTLTYAGTGIIDATRFLGVTTVDATEFGYLNGVTSAIQTQFGLKAPAANPTFTGLVTIPAYAAGTTGLVVSTTAVQTTGAQLNYLKDATGTTGTATGNLVFSVSPTFTGTPVLPTPFTIGAVSMTATGTQLNYLAGATGTTGTGSLVFDTAPTLGAATVTSINKVAFTAPAAGSTLRIEDGKTLRITKTMQLTSADDSTIATFPAGAVNVGVTGTLTNTKWCYTDGTSIICNQDAPTGSGTITAVGDINSGPAFTAAAPGKSLIFNNVTSGTIELKTVAGALGTGTVASLPAITGTIQVSPTTTTAGQVFQGTTTAGLGAWSTATYPLTTTANRILYSSATNVVGQITSGNSSVLVTDGSGVPSILTDIPTAVTIGGKYVYRADGTDVPVADGGTGVSTLTTAYGLLAAGTTATGTVQTLSAGATTTVLVGGGASALPVWTTATGTGAPVRAGSPTFTTSITTPILYTGVANTTAGQIVYYNATSGSITINPVTGALGTTVLTLPAKTGTIPTGTGTTNYAAYWTDANTLAGEAYLAVSRGGTGIGTGTQYGLPYFATTGLLGTTAAPASTTVVLHGNNAGIPTWSAVVEADITLADNTTNNVSNTKHGFVPKATDVTANFLRADGTWATPSGAGDVTAVGDCASGLCNDESSDGGTWIGLYSSSGAVRLRNNAGVMEARTAADAAYANFVAAQISTSAVDGSNKLTISNNTAIAPTGSAMELYPEANVWKLNQNGTEYSVPLGATATQVFFATGITSGGIPYGSAANTMSTSGVLAQYGVVIGGGAGAAPTSVAVGTNNQVFKGYTGSSPLFASLATGDLPIVPASKGGFGVANNDLSTLTITGNYGTTLTVSNTTAVTLPTSGTLQTTTGTPAGFIIASQAIGDLLTASSATAWARLVDVAAGQPLLSGGVGVIPAYAGYTFAGTAAQTYTFPSASATLAPIAAPNFSGIVGIGETANTGMTQGLTINQAANDNEILSFKSSDVSHAMTSEAEADTYGWIRKVSGTAGGLLITGVTDVTLDGALFLRGIIGAHVPTSTHAAVVIRGTRFDDDAGDEDLSATETVFRLDNHVAPLITVLGNGAITFAGDGTFSGGDIILGANTTTIGTVKMFGNTSGDVTITPPAVAGTATVLTLPATTGTLALNNQAMFIGTTSVNINRTTAALTLAGITLTTPNIGAATGDSLVLTGDATLTGGDLTLGANTTTAGTVKFFGGTSGSITLSPTAVAGTTTLTLPATSGTLAKLENKLSDLAATTSAELAGVVSNETGSGLLVFNDTPTLIAPVLGSATATQLLASGIVDGTAPMVITPTSAGYTLGATYKSGYTFTEPVAAAATFNFTLPTAAAGLQYCVGNGETKTGILKVMTSAAGQYIDLAGTLSASGGFVSATAVAGNFGCFIGKSATVWKAIPTTGTWSRD